MSKKKVTLTLRFYAPNKVWVIEQADGNDGENNNVYLYQNGDIHRGLYDMVGRGNRHGVKVVVEDSDAT